MQSEKLYKQLFHNHNCKVFQKPTYTQSEKLLTIISQPQ